MLRLRKGRLQQRMVLLIERKAEHARVAAAVLAFTQARADDGSAHGRLLEHPAKRDRGNRHPVFAGNRIGGLQNRLEGMPATNGLDEAVVLGLAPVGNGGRLALAQPALAQKAAGQRAIGQQLDAFGLAQLAHAPGRAPVEQRERHLVGCNRDAVAAQQVQVIGVKVGQSQVMDLAALAQLHQACHGIEIARVGVVPPVELHQVDALDSESAAPLIDPRLHARGRHLIGLGAPFGESVCGAGARLAQKLARDQLGAAVVVGHVEGIEPGLGIVGQVLDRWPDLEQASIALHVGHLPKAGDQSWDVQSGGQIDTVGALG